MYANRYSTHVGPLAPAPRYLHLVAGPSKKLCTIVATAMVTHVSLIRLCISTNLLFWPISSQVKKISTQTRGRHLAVAVGCLKPARNLPTLSTALLSCGRTHTPFTCGPTTETVAVLCSLFQRDPCANTSWYTWCGGIPCSRGSLFCCPRLKSMKYCRARDENPSPE